MAVVWAVLEQIYSDISKEVCSVCSACSAAGYLAAELNVIKEEKVTSTVNIVVTWRLIPGRYSTKHSRYGMILILPPAYTGGLFGVEFALGRAFFRSELASNVQMSGLQRASRNAQKCLLFKQYLFSLLGLAFSAMHSSIPDVLAWRADFAATTAALNRLQWASIKP